MKLTKFLFAVIFCVSAFNNSQAQAFEKGKNYVSAGYGAVTFIGALFNTYEDAVGYKSGTTGPLYLKYEYAVSDNFGIGLNVAYANTKVEYNEDYNGTNYDYAIYYNRLSFNARGNWHFGNNEKFDPYLGFGMGYNNIKFSGESNQPDYSDSNLDLNIPFAIGLEFTFGARYLFIPNLGVYAEVGLAKSIFQGGLVAKF